MTADELREKVAERFCESSSCVHFCKNFKKMPNGTTCLCGVDADAAIRVVIEAARNIAEEHAEDSKQTSTQYLMGRYYAACSIITGIAALLPEEQQ